MVIQPPDLLRYLPDFKVVVCTSCGYALQPSAISRHLKDIHHILRSSRKPFMKYVSALKLDDADTVIRSTEDLVDFPVPLLPVLDGLKCAHQGCSHMCVTEKRMKSHWAVEHSQPGRPGHNWTAVPLQTFFRGNSLRYFTKPSLLPVLRHQPQQNTAIGETDASLWQHYIKSTSITLADGSETLPIWQEIIPQFAKQCPFLMHGVLACAALHLAHLRPFDRHTHLITAATHQDFAMPLFREAIPKINAKNCNTIFAFIHTLVIYYFALDEENERLLLVDCDGPGVISNWLSFLRSGCDYIDGVMDSVRHGALKALLCQHMQSPEVKAITETPLLKRLLAVIPTKECEHAWSEQECEVYRVAVYDLDYAFGFADALGYHFNIWTALKIWPMLLSMDFLQLLRDLHPGALIALSHYCILMHKLDESWYLEGRAKRLSRNIFQRLDPKWHPYVEQL